MKRKTKAPRIASTKAQLVHNINHLTAERDKARAFARNADQKYSAALASVDELSRHNDRLAAENDRQSAMLRSVKQGEFEVGDKVFVGVRDDDTGLVSCVPAVVLGVVLLPHDRVEYTIRDANVVGTRVPDFAVSPRGNDKRHSWPGEEDALIAAGVLGMTAPAE